MNAISQLRQTIEQKKAELARLKQMRSSHVMFAPKTTLTADEQSVQAEDQFRAGAEAMMPWDPSKGTDMLLRADKINADREAKAQLLKEKQDAAEAKRNPKSAENVKDLAVQYRALIMQRGGKDFNNFSDEEKEVNRKSLISTRKMLSQTELGRALIGEVESDPLLNTEDNTSGTGTGTGAPAPAPAPAADPFASEETYIDTNAVDGKKINGIVENLAKLEAHVNKSIQDSGLPETDKNVISLRQYLKTQVESVRSQFETEQNIKERAAAEKRANKSAAQSSTSINAERAKLDVKHLVTSPNDNGYRRSALNDLLRSESGAAIGKNETLERIQTVLPDAIARQAGNEAASAAGWLASKFNADEQFTTNMVNKYLGSIDVTKLIEQLRIRSGETADQIANNPLNPGKHKEGDTWSDDKYIYRMFKGKVQRKAK